MHTSARPRGRGQVPRACRKGSVMRVRLHVSDKLQWGTLLSYLGGRKQRLSACQSVNSLPFAVYRLPLEKWLLVLSNKWFSS